MADPAAILSILIKAESAGRATQQIRALHEDLEKADRNAGKMRKGLETAGTRGAASLGRLHAQAAALGAEKAEPSIGLDTTEFDRNAQGVNDRLDRLDRSFRRANTGAALFERTRNLIKFPALITAAGVAAQGLSALSAAAIGAGSALAPLAGAYAAYPVLLGAATQATGVFTIATQGLAEALDGDEKALAKLTPEARAFVGVLQGVKAEVDTFVPAIQGGMFPGFAAGIQSASRALVPLKGVAVDTGEALGQLGREAGAAIGSDGVLRDIESVGDRNVGIIANLGRAGIQLGNAFRHIVVAAGPLTSWLSQMALRFATLINRQAEFGRKSGALTKFFESTRQTMGVVGRILLNVAAGLWEVAKAGKPLGDDLLRSLEGITEQFKLWAQSTAGRRSLAAYFADARPAIYAVAKLIGEIGAAFLRLSRGDQVAPLIDQIRTQMLPVLESVVKATTEAFGPHIINLLTEVFRLWGALAGSSGPLVAYVDLLAGIAGGLANVLSHNPALQTMVVTIAGLVGVAKAVSFTASLSGITALIGGLKTLRLAYIAETGIANASTLAALRHAAAVKISAAAARISAAASKAAAVATAAWSLVLRANPIMLVVTALAALGAAFFVAYKKSETFRNIVNGAFNAIKTVAAAVFGWLRGAVRDIAGFLTRIWQAIKTVLAAYWAGYRAIIINPIRSAFSWLKGAARDVAGFLARIWETIKTGVATYWRGYRALIIDPIRSAISWVKDRIGGLVGWLAGRWDAIRGGLRSFGASVRNMLSDAFRGAANTVIGFINAIIGAINKIPGVEIRKIPKIGEDIVNANTRAYRGQGNLGGTGHMAQGGAFARTGGRINRPMVMMGEEAPTHPEYVVPTNPAYRGRARELLAQAASAIGMQAGGMWSKGALAKLWQRVNPGLGDPNLMAAIALAESGGRQSVVNSIGAGGLWQIYPPESGYLDPVRNAQIAGRKLRTQGLKAWEAYTNESYRRFLGGGGGILGKIGGILGDIGGAMGGLLEKGADFILDKLPNPADMLPGWLVGTGKWAIGKVTEWVKNKVADILPGGGGGPLGDLGGALGGLMDVARRMGLAITSTTSGGHVKGSLHYAGRAFDAAGDPGAMMAFARQMASGYGRNLAELFFDPLGWSVKNGRRVGWTVGGHTDHVHVAMRQGGIFGGAFAEGGIVPGPVGAARMIMAHAGELVVPMKKGAKHQKPRGGVGRLQKITSRAPKKTKPTKGEKAIAQARASVPPFVFQQLNREIGRLQYQLDLLSARGVSEDDPRVLSLENQMAFVLRRRAAQSKQLKRTADMRRDVVEATRLEQMPGVVAGEVPGIELPDTLRRAQVIASMTPDMADDEAVKAQAAAFWQGQWDAAVAGGASTDVLEQIAQNLGPLKEALEEQRKAAEEAKRREEERNSLLREQTQNQRRLLAVAEGEPARMLAALVAAVNGDIGGRVGLGFASPSYAGRMARY